MYFHYYLKKLNELFSIQWSINGDCPENHVFFFWRGTVYFKGLSLNSITTCFLNYLSWKTNNRKKWMTLFFRLFTFQRCIIIFWELQNFLYT